MKVIVVPNHYNGFTVEAIKKHWNKDVKVGDIVDLELPLFGGKNPPNLKIKIK